MLSLKNSPIDLLVCLCIVPYTLLVIIRLMVLIMRTGCLRNGMEDTRRKLRTTAPTLRATRMRNPRKKNSRKIRKMIRTTTQMTRNRMKRKTRKMMMIMTRMMIRMMTAMMIQMIAMSLWTRPRSPLRPKRWGDYVRTCSMRLILRRVSVGFSPCAIATVDEIHAVVMVVNYNATEGVP